MKKASKLPNTLLQKPKRRRSQHSPRNHVRPAQNSADKNLLSILWQNVPPNPRYGHGHQNGTAYTNLFMTIKFTYESSETSIDFLDITVYKVEKFARQSKLDIKPYFKPTNKFQYLQYSSAHPKSTFSSIIKGELTRVLRNCSKEQEHSKTSTKMAKIFKDRGYPTQLVDRIQNKVPYSARPELIKPREKEPCQYQTFLVTEYTPDLNIRKIKKTIKPTHEKYIPAPCLSLKKSKTLSKKLVKAMLKNVDDPTQSIEPITQSHLT